MSERSRPGGPNGGGRTPGGVPGPREGRPARAARPATSKPPEKPRRAAPARTAGRGGPPPQRSTTPRAKASASPPRQRTGTPTRPAAKRPAAKRTSTRGPAGKVRTATRTTGRPGARRPTTPRIRKAGPGAGPRPPLRFAARVADPDRRVMVAVGVVLVVLLVFGGRLVQLQGVDSSALAAAALAERTKTVDLPAHRGDILDSSGAVLATTVERRNITVDPTLVHLYKKRVGDQRVTVGVDGAVADIARIIRQPVAVVRKALTGTGRFQYVAKDVTPEMWRDVARLSVPGISYESANRRLYPAGAVAGNIVGFVARDGKPKDGVERAWGEQLAGTNGVIRYEKAADGTQIPTGVSSETEPRNGETVTLTIDRDLQWKAQELLDAQVAKTKAENGYVIVTDPKTGQVLAMASSPTLDPNHPTANPPGNKALTDVFEPGSTSKVITAAAAVEEGKVAPGTRLLVPDKIHRAGRTFNDSHSHAPEKMTFAGVLAESSNVGTIMVGENLSNDQLHGYMTAFGYGSRTGVGLPETKGILAEAKDWSGSQRYTTMFGQGVAVSALQATDVFSTIANDGVRITPSIVRSTTDADGVVHDEAAGTKTRVVSARTAQTVRQMLESVVGEDGTAAEAEIPGYRVAGKTGTAQAPDDKGGYSGYTSSFIGMAPAEDPALVVSVVLQRPQNGHYGGIVAAPVFQQLMTYALAKRGVAPTGTKAPELPLTYN